MDIKQRAVLVSKQNNMIKICAEPSPDALSAYAAELAGKANLPESTAAQFAASFQEGSAFVGLRTQSIQLLRDSLYRLCEGYMSGALDKEEYNLLTRRYQRYMVGLLAVEQLTGALRSPAVVINTDGEAKVDGETVSTEGKTSAEKITVTSQQTGDINAVVAKVVKEIVMQVVKTDDTGSLCFSYLKSSNSHDDPVAIFCKDVFSSRNAMNQLRLKYAASILDKKTLTDDDKELLTLLMYGNNTNGDKSEPILQVIKGEIKSLDANPSL
ncbi:MAG: hypothetical protein D3920_13190 [Candidatus Electrothrix sp. AW2]|nr:hypothetical protein [Candidatus Electrothrix gigas]MCI5180478.1 hypothetical protein [Candidatus Electrothrix gigas]